MTTILKRVYQKSRRRPNIAISENHIRFQNIKIAPGNSTYASMTKYGKKLCIIGDSHIKRVRRNVFNNLTENGKPYLKSFRGAKVQHLHHFIELILSEDHPNMVIITHRFFIAYLTEMWNI